MEQKFINIKQASHLVCLIEGKRLFDKDELIEWVRSKRDKRCEQEIPKRKEVS
jgi:hypothetical protein